MNRIESTGGKWVRGFAAIVLAISGLGAGAGTIPVPNGSFESPATQFVDNRVGSWQKVPKPFWFVENDQQKWDQLTGVFLNTAADKPDHINNVEGKQAFYLFALPSVGLFQDADSIEGTNTKPSHLFNSKFEVGKAYDLTVSVVGGGGGMTNGASLLIGLYYRDQVTNFVTVAASNVVYSPGVFTNQTHLVDVKVHVPVVKATDAWAGKSVGIQIISSIQNQALIGGYWDFDNVRLTDQIEVPNGSFESPGTQFVDNNVGSWQKVPKPFWFVENEQQKWNQLSGVFLNTAADKPDHIDNVEGKQAFYLFALPTAGVFQDYDSISGTNATPAHEFDTKFQIGRSYDLTVGVVGGGGGMTNGASLLVGLYYRDQGTNLVTVAASNVVYTPAAFPNQTHLTDVTVRLPVVKATDAWAGKHVGIQIISSIQNQALVGGYWDFDNVRLASTSEAVFSSPSLVGNTFTSVIRSEPGLTFEVLQATNLALSASQWTSLGKLTNVFGALIFTHINPATNQSFYALRQVP